VLNERQNPTAAGGQRGSVQRTMKIRNLNDALRRKLPRTGKGGRFNVTDSVAALPAEQLARLIVSIRDFADFSENNDPHGEHDFGAIEQEGDRFFWKIDCYDQWMQFGSPDPADPSVTVRVLTVMLADEY
jgi:hypothetical protein